MHSIHYINCLLVTVAFLEQLLNEVPVNSPLWRQIRQRVGLYRHVIHRDYLVPILGMNQLQSTDSWFDIFKAPAINDFQMMINSVYIFIYKIAQYHVCMFTREFSLRLLDVRRYRISCMKKELFQKHCVYVNAIYMNNITEMNDIATDNSISLDQELNILI